MPSFLLCAEFLLGQVADSAHAQHVENQGEFRAWTEWTDSGAENRSTRLYTYDTYLYIRYVFSLTSIVLYYLVIRSKKRKRVIKTSS